MRILRWILLSLFPLDIITIRYTLECGKAKTGRVKVCIIETRDQNSTATVMFYTGRIFHTTAFALLFIWSKSSSLDAIRPWRCEQYTTLCDTHFPPTKLKMVGKNFQRKIQGDKEDQVNIWSTSQILIHFTSLQSQLMMKLWIELAFAQLRVGIKTIPHSQAKREEQSYIPYCSGCTMLTLIDQLTWQRSKTVSLGEERHFFQLLPFHTSLCLF